MAENNDCEASQTATNQPQLVKANQVSQQKSWPEMTIPSDKTKKFHTRQYSYTDLKNVVPDSVVDIYGVVKFFKLPEKTKGTDYRQVVSLVDPTFCGDNKLTCLLFARDEASLPPVKKGSIVRFHRLRIGLHNGALQGMKASGFSWLLIDVNAQGPVVEKASTTNYSFADVDTDKIQDLQKWIRGQKDFQDNEESFCLEKIVPGGYFNLVCQIVSVCLVEEDVCLLLRVWDGTSTNYQIREIELGSDEYVVNVNEEIQEKANGFIYDVCIFDNHVKKAGNIQPGTFVKLYNLHAAQYKNETNEEESGVEVLELVLHRGSSYGRGMKVLQDSEPEVCVLRGRFQQVSHRTENRSKQGSSPSDPQPGCSTDDPMQGKRKAKDDLIRIAKRKTGLDASCSESLESLIAADLSTPQSLATNNEYCMISTISLINGHNNIKISSILDIIKRRPPSKFRLLTRVVDYFPKLDSSPNFIKLYCTKCHFIVGSNEKKFAKYFKSKGNVILKCPSCPECKRSSPHMEFIFKLKLLTVNSQSYLIINVWKEEAIKFFGGLTPQQVLNNPDAYEHLSKVLNLICPTAICLSQRPMMECCIKSYSDEKSSVVHYQMFDTALVQ